MPAAATAPPPPIESRPSTAGPATVPPPYPLAVAGAIQHGFGRGSRDLGCPTANLPDDQLHDAMFTESGVYFGWARLAEATGVDDGSVRPMVMSVGWNPVYGNTKRTAEVHILHHYPNDFYGHHLRVVVLGFIRPEYNYSSLDDLIKDIEKDKQVTLESLDRPSYQDFKTHPFLFQDPQPALL